MLKEPIEIVQGNMTETIGHPRDIAENMKANGSVNFNVETPIPRTASTPSKNKSSGMIVDSETNGNAAPVTAFEEVVASQKSDGKK